MIIQVRLQRVCTQMHIEVLGGGGGNYFPPGSGKDEQNGTTNPITPQNSQETPSELPSHLLQHHQAPLSQLHHSQQLLSLSSVFPVPHFLFLLCRPSCI